MCGRFFFSLPRLCSLSTLCHIFTPLLFLGEEHQLANFVSPLPKFAVVFCDFSSSYLSIFLSKCQVLFSVSFFSFFSFLFLFQTYNLSWGDQRTPAKGYLVYICSLTGFFVILSLTTSSSLHEPDKISFRIFSSSVLSTGQHVLFVHLYLFVWRFRFYISISLFCVCGSFAFCFLQN